MIEHRLVEEVLHHVTTSVEFEKQLDFIIDGSKDPYSSCDELLSAKLNFLVNEDIEKPDLQECFAGT